MPTLESARQKRASVLQQIAEASYAYPNDEFPDREFTTNFPEEQLGVRVRSGGWLYPDIVVTDEPGHFIAFAADLALTHEVTNDTAVERWMPLSQAAPLILYVPMGQSGRAIRLCRLNGIKLHKLMIYRQRPAGFGIDLQEAYSGPDLLKPIAGLLPPALRPMAYRNERMRVVDGYLNPAPADRTGDVPAIAAPAPQPDATLALPSGLEDEHGAGEHDSPESHLPPPSLAPILFALGLIVMAAGAIFVGELLSVGITLIVLGAVRWFMEDMGYFEAGGPAEYRQHPLKVMPDVSPPPGVHLPPPSLMPLLFAAGLMITAAGAVFTDQVLGAGITLIVFGGVGWLLEDIRYFEEPVHDDHHDEHESDAPLMHGADGAEPSAG
ncbi:MAG: hypothetical protein F4Y69_03330 [Chloroflexi bacterium]|nr:hypothetical protein [Chloroflexota bacterium]MXX80049.1 hypothetical protein [Chloroflexota bacterium]MYD16927.1 hypothetical protein [Chloroflexota bacterium]MYF21915.1 hypothetical protein [Chloroflexota bacterium]MYJ00955.1 hypothetical protein [Chloroflexota bacterium]